MNDIETLKEHVSTDVYARVFANRHLCALLADGAYLVSFRFCDITDPMQKDERVVAWCAGENLLFYTDCRRCRDLIEATDENAAPLLGQTFRHQVVPIELGPGLAFTSVTASNAWLR